MDVTVSRHFLAWLHDARLSLAFTTYQTNRLFLIGLKPDGSLSLFERHFDRPMGLHAVADRLHLSTRWQLWELVNALPDGEEHQGYDRLYVPRRAHTTGDLDVHDVALEANARIVFVNTLYSCLATVSERYSFAPLWQPPFISRLAPEDRCHLNGLAMADGAPAFVTAVSRSDVAAGWRERRDAGGCVVDVDRNAIVLDGLSMPHSPRLHGNRLWVLNSGAGELGWVDRTACRFEPVAFCPGYLRGMAVHGDYAVVGLSKQRQDRTFSGLALDDRLRQKDTDARCGLWVVDLRSGDVVHWLEIEGTVIELYDVAVLPGVRRPMALGFQTDEIGRLLTLDLPERPRFVPLQATVVEAPAAQQDAPVPASGAALSDPGSEAARTAFRLGNALVKAGRFAEAISQFEQTLRLDPSHVNAQINLGTAHHRCGDIDAALACYRAAATVDPRSVRAHANLAMMLRDRGEPDQAILHYERAVQLEPANGQLVEQLGVTLYEAGRLREAKRRLEEAIRLDPRSASAHNGLGAVLKITEQDDEALRMFERATLLKPDLAEAHENMGKIFEARGQQRMARQAIARGLAIRPDPLLELHRELLCPPVFASVAELDEYRRRAESVIDGFSRRRLPLPLARVQATRAEPPFEWTYHGRDNLPLKRQYAALFAGSFPREPLERRPRATGPWHVGFVVTPTHEGVFLRCMGGVVDRLDRSRFRPAIACARPAHATVRAALRSPDVQLLDLPVRFDHAVTALRAARFDLLYFWEVGTDASNYFFPFSRLAPVQCTGWGWPDTSAAPELDYHLTSEALATRATDGYFSEAVVRLPHLPAYCSRPPVDNRSRPVEGFDLPAGAHAYVCPQNLRKVHPDFDLLIAGILRADPRGVAVFVHDRHPTAGEMLERRWRQTMGDVARRVVVLPRQAPAAYLRLLASAHVLLDTLYFGGSNTLYDAFAVGTPTVTLPTELPRGRYAAALNRAAGLDELVARTPGEYVEIAVQVASDETLLAGLKERIVAAGDTVFEAPGAVEQLETFFAEAVRHAALR